MQHSFFLQANKLLTTKRGIWEKKTKKTKKKRPRHIFQPLVMRNRELILSGLTGDHILYQIKAYAVSNAVS